MGFAPLLSLERLLFRKVPERLVSGSVNGHTEVTDLPQSSEQHAPRSKFFFKAAPIFAGNEGGRADFAARDSNIGP